MKKILILLALVAFTGCKKFLAEVDQDKLIPQTTDQYAALLLKEFNSQYPIFGTVDHMTDNVTEDPKALTSIKFNYKTTYTWQREIEIDENGNTVSGINTSWQNMYEDVAVTNYVIAQIDGAIGTTQDIQYIKGEAYFIRAFSYFNLVNLYGQPFNAATADVDLGVPIRDDIGVELTYNRNTVAECYQAIESDLNNAITLIKQSGITKSVWHPNLPACYLLMSRVKLYQEKWDDAITYSNYVINAGHLTKISATSPFVTANNPEILYSYYTVNPIFNLYSSGTTLSQAGYYVSNDLISLYDSKDIRKQAFFLAIDDGSGKYYYRPKKYQRDTYTTLGFANFRVAEAYLNRAEAYAQKGEYASAINDVKTLQTYRYSDVSQVVYPTNNSDVLPYVLNERRKELCFEDHHRWFDLRRMKNRPEIKHIFTVIDDNGIKIQTEQYTLLSNDINYTLPIPLKERQNNPLIRNNDRYEKIPVIL